MKLCKTGAAAAAADEDKGSDGTRTKIRSRRSQACCSYCSLVLSLSRLCLRVEIVFNFRYLTNGDTSAVAKPRAPNRTLTICSTLLRGASLTCAHSCSACLSANLSSLTLYLSLSLDACVCHEVLSTISLYVRQRTSRCCLWHTRALIIIIIALCRTLWAEQPSWAATKIALSGDMAHMGSTRTDVLDFDWLDAGSTRLQ